MGSQKSEAWCLVEDWLKTQDDLPPDSYVTSDQLEQGFSIFWRHPEYGTVFSFARVKVLADSTVQVLRDYREQIKKTLENPSGLAREIQFTKALEVRTKSTPPWFLAIKRGTPFTDRRGIDGFAKISVMSDADILKIPYQIKSSRGGKEHYLKKRPHSRDVVMVFVVREEDSDDMLRQHLYSAAGQIRSRLLKREITKEEFKELIRRVANY